MEDPPSLLVDSDPPWQIPYSPPIREEPDKFRLAVNSLTVGGGGDERETLFSGVSAALGLDWRGGVCKLAIVIGDAQPHSPEPISGLTEEALIKQSLALDPVQVVAVDVGELVTVGLGEIAEQIGGSVIREVTDLSETLVEVVETMLEEPFAWLGEAYVGRIGTPIEFDASASYDPSGDPLESYEWDFDGDGVFDETTLTPSVITEYDSEYTGIVLLRVTGTGGSALASARLTVNESGSVPMGETRVYPSDEDGLPIIVDADGSLSSFWIDPEIWPV